MARRPSPRLKRRRFQKEAKRLFVVFCEGKRTEPAYFEALRRSVADSLVDVRTIPEGGVPMTLAKSAINMKKEMGLSRSSRAQLNSFEENDQIWVVFDRDEHPKYYDAISMCEANEIGVGRSNPCFELWLILHEQDYNKPDGRHEVQAQLRKLRPEYDPRKGKTPDCECLVSRVEDAERRARKLFKDRVKEAGKNQLGPPYTTVGKLTKAIRFAGQG